MCEMLHGVVLLHKPFAVVLYHTHDNLLIHAVAIAQYEEDIGGMGYGVGVITRYAHIIHPMMLVFLLCHEHLHVVHKLPMVRVGNAVGEIHSRDEGFVLAAVKIAVVFSCCLCRNVLWHFFLARDTNKHKRQHDDAKEQ